MDTNLREETDKLCAGVFAAGLRVNLIPREKMIAWAGNEIAERPTPEMWIIDLSMSQQLHDVDLMSSLKRVANGVVGEKILRAILSLMQLPEPMSFEDADRIALKLYRLAADCLDWDWSSPLMCEADQLSDEFALISEGIIQRRDAEVVRRVTEFVTGNRLAELPASFQVATFAA